MQTAIPKRQQAMQFFFTFEKKTRRKISPLQRNHLSHPSSYSRKHLLSSQFWYTSATKWPNRNVAMKIIVLCKFKVQDLRSSFLGPNFPGGLSLPGSFLPGASFLGGSFLPGAAFFPGAFFLGAALPTGAVGSSPPSGTVFLTGWYFGTIERIVELRTFVSSLGMQNICGVRKALVRGIVILFKRS